jgi:hypothetical protein
MHVRDSPGRLAGRMVPPASIARTSCSIITRSKRVSSNQSLCCPGNGILPAETKAPKRLRKIKETSRDVTHASSEAATLRAGFRPPPTPGRRSTYRRVPYARWLGDRMGARARSVPVTITVVSLVYRDFIPRHPLAIRERRAWQVALARSSGATTGEMCQSRARADSAEAAGASLGRGLLGGADAARNAAGGLAKGNAGQPRHAVRPAQS